MARFALQSPPDARFRQVTLPKTDWSESAWRGAGCVLGQSGESVAVSANPGHRGQSSPFEYTDSSNEIIYQ